MKRLVLALALVVAGCATGPTCEELALNLARDTSDPVAQHAMLDANCITRHQQLEDEARRIHGQAKRAYYRSRW